MKHILFVLFLLSATVGTAQENNVFLGRDFWKTNPSVADIKMKIAEGNDPVALNPFNFDATCYAILEKAPMETMKFLLDMEGNAVNKKTHDGRNYLMWAAYKGNKALMTYLIERGADTKIIDDHGYNLMTFAGVAGIEDPAVYEIILAHGGKVTDTNRNGANALLLLAPHLKDKKIINYFKGKGLKLDSKDKDGNGMFYYASKMGNLAFMKDLVKMGLDYKGKNKSGGNAMLAAASGFRRHTNGIDVFRYLDQLGIDANVMSKEGNTPLHYLAWSGKDPAIFDFFIKKGVNPNTKNDAGNTFLMNMISGMNVESLLHYLPLLKDVNMQNKKGHAPITHALRRNSEFLTGLFLGKGANLDIKDADGNNLFYYVFNAYRPKSSQAFDHHVDLLKLSNIDPMAKQKGGNTLLHIAVDKGAAALIEKAIELGVNINAKNDDGLSPLHVAAMKAKDTKILKLLLDKGADKMIKTSFGESVYDLANENELLLKSNLKIDFLK